MEGREREREGGAGREVSEVVGGRETRVASGAHALAAACRRRPRREREVDNAPLYSIPHFNFTMTASPVSSLRKGFGLTMSAAMGFGLTTIFFFSSQRSLLRDSYDLTRPASHL